MVVGKDPRAELPANFAAAVASLRPVRLRAEIRLSEAPAPQRLAPFAVALTADVAGADGEDIVTGRFVVLHDPAGQEAWHGTTVLTVRKGGTVVMPLEKTFWAARFGMVVDRFGIPWLINCEASDQALGS